MSFAMGFVTGFISAILMFYIIIYWTEIKRMKRKLFETFDDMYLDIRWMLRDLVRRARSK